MAVGKDISVLEFDGLYLLAVSAIVSSDQITVRRWLVAELPPSIDINNASKLGQWISAECARGQIPTSRVIFSIARADVVLKQVALPAGATLTSGELSNLVRLQMVRQLAMQVEGASIDFIPSRAPDTKRRGDASLAQPTVATVATAPLPILAAALPSDRFIFIKELAAAASMKLHRITLRCCGAAAMVAELSQRKAGAVLGITLGSRAIEFIVVSDGQLLFARSADLAVPQLMAEPAQKGEAEGHGEHSNEVLEAFADRVAVEAKRTWMAFGASPGLGLLAPELIAVTAPENLTRLIGERTALALCSHWEQPALPAYIKLPEGLPRREFDLLAPLLGLLVEQLLTRPSLDFANPRKLPDPAAKRRRTALVAALALIVTIGGGYVLADRALGGLRGDLTAAQANEAKLRKDFDTFQLTHAKVSHFESWAAAKVDWLGHMQKLTESLPVPTAGVVDEVSARGVTSIRYSFGTPSSGYIGGLWNTSTQVIFDLGGKVRSRQIASDLRERLMNGGIYGVESQGPDVPDKFAFGLSSAQLSPFAEPCVTPAPIAVVKKHASKPAKKTQGPATSAKAPPVTTPKTTPPAPTLPSSSPPPATPPAIADGAVPLPKVEGEK